MKKIDYFFFFFFMKKWSPLFAQTMCGIFGLFGTESVAQEMFDALTVLQHRGQDAAGMATADREGRFFLHKYTGLVRDVFHTRHMRDMASGTAGIGHVRYPTAGCASPNEAQPFYVNSPYGIVLAHNGNLTNAESLARELFESDLRHLATTSDSEVLLNVFAHELARQKKTTPTAEDIFAAISATQRRCLGAYAVVGMISGVGMFAFRDPHGIRPLVLGQRLKNGKTEYALSSETVAFLPLDFETISDVGAGEGIFISQKGNLHRKICAENPKLTPCLFELVYMARPDSLMDGISVYKSRLRMGECLAKKIRETSPDLPVDVVIPIPDSGRTSAVELAFHLGVKYREGFVKNRYIGRTFIMPGQAIRKKSVKYKLSPIELEFRDKNVMLVDDSIVRGTTSKQIIQMARDAGAKNVYFASAAPAVRFPNVYGIDMPTRAELIAYGISETEVGKIIGADALFYQDLDDLIQAAREGNPNISSFEASCFDGKYITGDIDENFLRKVESGRGAKLPKNNDDVDQANPMTLL